MTYRIILVEAARADLREIATYLRSAAGEGVAESLIEEIIHTAESLRTMPERQRLRRELGPGLRALSAGNYILFYRVIDNEVSILRVLHGSRNITPSLFTEL